MQQVATITKSNIQIMKLRGGGILVRLLLSCLSCLRCFLLHQFNIWHGDLSCLSCLNCCCYCILRGVMLCGMFAFFGLRVIGFATLT